MKTLLLVLLLFPLLGTTCYADSAVDELAKLTDAYSVQNALGEGERKISGTLTLDGSYDTQGALSRLWKTLLEKGKERLDKEIRDISAVVVLAILAAATSAVCGEGNARTVLDRVVCCLAVLRLTDGLDSLLHYATETLHRFTDYSRVILPVLFTSAAASGAVVSSSARYAAACLTMDVMMTASQRFLLPTIYLFLALAVTRSLYDNSLLQVALNVSRWAIVTGLTVLTMVFGAYLSLTGLLAGSTDALALKTTRMIISRALPVVGGLLSDSAATLLSAASLVKNSLGVFAMVAVSAMCVGPVALFSVKLLVYRGAAAVVSLWPESSLPKLLESFGTAYGMLLALVGCNAAMLFLALVSGIKAAT